MGERWGKQVELFLSTYVNKVDRKGRVSVPATFRSTLATHRQPSLVIVFPSFTLPALEGTGSDRMEEMHERIESLEQFSEEHENLSQLFADAHPLTIDGEGRVILPEKLKEYARLHGTGPGWLFLTGSPDDIELLRHKLGYVDLDPEVDKDRSRHSGMVRFGNEALSQWAACQGQARPEWIAKELSFVVPRVPAKPAEVKL